MGTFQEELALEQLAARLAELEQANTQLREELHTLRVTHHASTEAPTHPSEKPLKRVKKANQKTISTLRKSRRILLRQGLGVTVAAVGAGTLMGASTMQALAAGPHGYSIAPDDHTGKFSSSKTNIPAVKATGTNGATGVSASSDSGPGVLGSSNDSGIYGNGGNVGVSGSGGNFGIYGTGGIGVKGLGISYGVVGSAGAHGTGVAGESTNGYGVYATSETGSAVYAFSG